MCAGVIEPCWDEDSCTSTFVGPCDAGRSTASVFFRTQFVGVGMVDEARYLSCDEHEACEHLAIADPVPGRMYRDTATYSYSTHLAYFGVHNVSYAYMMAGAAFGEGVGGNIAIASFLNTGEERVNATQNEFYFWTPTSGDAPQARPGSAATGRRSQPTLGFGRMSRSSAAGPCARSCREGASPEGPERDA